MPLKGTRVIPAGWGAHHAEAAAGGMTAECEIRDPGAFTETFDPRTGETTIVPAPPVYAGRCRVQAMSRREAPADAVGQEVIQPPYVVQVDHDAPALDEGWVVRITACDEDPQLAGRRLTIRQVVYGTQRFTRDLFCDDE